MKKITVDNEPVFFENNDFQTILIRVVFPFKKDVNEIAKTNILPGLLNNVCSKYDTESKLLIELQKRYINLCYCSFYSLLDNYYYVFYFLIPDVDALGEDLLENQFELFSEIMYNPKLNGNRFCTPEFDKEINNLKLDIANNEKNAGRYAFIKSREAVDPDGYFSATIYNHKEQIDYLTEENMYDFYCDKIYNNHPLIFVFGNMDKSRISKLCHKYLYRTSFDKIEYNISVSNFFPIKNNITKIVEDSKFNDSIYYLYFKVKDMTEDDYVLLGTVNNLLSSQSSRLLSKKLRDEHDLVYSCVSNNNNIYGLLSIVSYIQDKNVDFVKANILEVIDLLHDEDLVGELLDNIKSQGRIALIRQLDDKGSLFHDKIVSHLEIDYTLKEKYEKLLTITPHDISLFVDRLVLDTEYFLKEGAHE